MRTVATLIAAVLFMAISPAVAEATGKGGVDHGQNVRTDTANTNVDIFAQAGQVHAIVIREQRCWYPMEWKDDIVTRGQESPYYLHVGRLIDSDYEWFKEGVPAVGGESCVQHVYDHFGSCTDEDRIGVRAIDVLWDAREGTIGSLSDIGLHEYPDRYCLEIVDIDRWRQIISASDYLPQPVRATYPQFRTLVGLENQIWYDVAGGEDRYTDGFYVELPTPGITYNINVSTWLEEIAIDIDGDGDWDHTVTCSTGEAESLTDCGGSLENPIFTFGYEERAFHHFVIESRWAGEAIDEAGVVHILDPAHLTIQHAFDWETIEVRSSLDG